MKHKLKPSDVKNAEPRDKEYNLSDGDGLFLRVRPSGAKSWVYFFRLSEQRNLNRMTLGSEHDFSLKEARQELDKVRDLVRQGIDPRAARKAAKVENTQAITMQSLFDAWLAFEVGTDQNSIQWAKRHKDRWNLHLRESLGDIFVKDISRHHLTKVLEAMVLAGIREETRKALTTLNLILDYGLKHQHLKENPARLLRPKDFKATAGEPRDRTLSLEELSSLWFTLDQMVISTNGLSSASTVKLITSSAIKLLILTGARRGEVAKMAWKELDLLAGVWSLPKERTKNSRAHIIYLSECAIEIIKKLQSITGDSLYVFDTGRGVHIREDTLTRAISRLQQSSKSEGKNRISNLAPFTVHDIRRSAATAWGEHLSILPHIIEKMLNHQPMNKLIATYQRATHANEQKNAWLAWGKMVEDLLHGV